uniref:Annexin n=1 Tax=Globisporangium ultimum (strain ATCC 200006 / CBS 805.95 / DAOM BR144) TaxID=431595 RepID=K3WZ29_GLOUD
MQHLYPPSVHELQRQAPSVFPLAVNNACAEIKNACKGLGTDEAALTEVLCSVTPNDRSLVAYRYKELYLEDLKFLLESETSSDLGFLLQLMAVPLNEAEAYALHAAVTGPFHGAPLIYPVILGRTSAELVILKKTYFDIFNQELTVMAKSELSGDLRTIIITALQSQRAAYDPSVHTEEKAEEDTDNLYKAGEGKWGTDEDSFVKLLVTSPPEHLAAIDAVYRKKYNKSIKGAIDAEFSGDAKHALYFYVDWMTDRNKAIADVFENAMVGFGTNEKALSAAVIRYQPFLSEVQPVYEKLHGKPLKERIAEETSGDYSGLLLALFDTPVSEPFAE